MYSNCWNETQNSMTVLFVCVLNMIEYSVWDDRTSSLYRVKRRWQLTETCLRTCIFNFSIQQRLLKCLWGVKRGVWKHGLWSVMKTTPELKHRDFEEFFPKYENKCYESHTKTASTWACLCNFVLLLETMWRAVETSVPKEKQPSSVISYMQPLSTVFSSSSLV